MSELALKLIAENKTKHAHGEDARTLDLSGCNLKKIPEEAFDLIWLETFIINSCSTIYEQYIGGERWDERPIPEVITQSQIERPPNKITTLPNEISKLKKLKKLDVSWIRRDSWERGIHNIDALAGLPNLSELVICKNEISDISPLRKLQNLTFLDFSENNVSNLNDVENLLELRILNFSFNQVHDLYPLNNLLKLTHLYCNTNRSRIPNLPLFEQLRISSIEPLGTLKNLIVLEAFDNNIEIIKAIENATNLTRLNFSFNSIIDLSPLINLTKLEELLLRKNRVTDLRPIQKFIKKGIDIDVADNPLTIPPIEIVNLGYNPILKYFEELEKKAQFKNTEIKLILVGNSTTGKTSLSRFLLKHTYQSGEPTTHGICNDRWELEGREMQVNIWDFGGQEYYHATHRLFLSRNAVYILVWDSQTEKGGFCKTPIHFHNDSEPSIICLEHFPKAWWLKNIQHYTSESNPSVPVLLVQNKCARDGVKRVSEIFEKPPFNMHPEWLDNHIDLEAAASYLTNPQPETRRWWRNFEAFEEKLLDKLQSQLTHYEFAVYHRDIRDKVRQLASEGMNEMAWIDFEALCRGIEADAKMDLVQIYLRDITGDILYYPNNARLKERVFLRPIWVCDSIYQILSRKVQAQHGVFGLDWVREALRCSEDQALNFVELMREFELVFDDTDDTGQPTGQLVAPQYLPDECTQPGELGGAKKFANLTHAFTLWFPEFLPKSHIARFVAYWGSKAKHRLFWKNGLLFQTEGCTALVERTSENKIRVDLQSSNPKRAEAIRRIFQSFLHLEDGQAEFALSLDDRNFVSWRDVLEAMHIQGRQIKTYSDTEAAKYIELQPFYTFHQPSMPQPKKVFISYSHKDEDAMKELDKFLGPLERKGEITIWTDRKILPGQNWKDAILNNLEDADLTLLLVSANFLDSDFINKEEIPRAFQRMNEHGKHVIPIILNYCLWDITSLSALQATPKDGRPIADFGNPAQAWSEVARGILGLLKA